jgi:hypothetical protein
MESARGKGERLTLHQSLEVGRYVLGLLLGVLQLLLQVGRLLLCLARHDLLHTLDFTRSYDLDL